MKKGEQEGRRALARVYSRRKEMKGKSGNCLDEGRMERNEGRRRGKEDRIDL